MHALVLRFIEIWTAFETKTYSHYEYKSDHAPAKYSLEWIGAGA